MSEEQTLEHQSGVNKAGSPFVQLLLGGKIVAQMDTVQARDHARAITEAAEAAEQDAFMMEFLQEKIGLSWEQAATVLVEFRQYRVRTFKSQGPVDKEVWVMPEAKP